MNNNNLVRNIKILVVFFSICFFSIIVYLTYFNIFVADKIVDDPTNKRNRVAENEVLRGSILDRKGDILAYSVRTGEGKQERRYKNGELFSHALGYNSYVYGKTGIESAYNDVLQGRGFTHDILGTIFRSVRQTLNKEDKKGNNVILTIDRKTQKAAFDGLGNERGAVVAMDPRTGAILAMVSKPSFDPGEIDKNFKEYNSDADGTPFLNRATNGYYPPGSTFKIITSAAALENIPAITSDIFQCKGRLNIGNYTLKDFNGERHGKVDIKEAFVESCNYTFGTLGMRLGFDNLRNTAEKFMFNKEIPVNDDYNSLKIREGQIEPDKEESRSYNAQDAIGQHNVSANPMQMALVASTIANDGVMMKPYIVGEIQDRYGVTIEKKTPDKIGDVISSSVSNTIKDYMIDVVKYGTGKRAKISGITVAGKTGTAEDKDKTHSWFVAFAPADNPQIAVAVIVENGGTGGKRAASIARDVIKEYLNK